jgi:hypothetical protein
MQNIVTDGSPLGAPAQRRAIGASVISVAAQCIAGKKRIDKSATARSGAECRNTLPIHIIARSHSAAHSPTRRCVYVSATPYER